MKRAEGVSLDRRGFGSKNQHQSCIKDFYSFLISSDFVLINYKFSFMTRKENQARPLTDLSRSEPRQALISSARPLLLPHVSRDGAADLRAPFVLSKIVHKLPVGSHQVHDDGVVHLRTARVSKGGVGRRPPGAANSRCSRRRRLWDPDCSKLGRTWRPAGSEPAFPSGRSASERSLEDRTETCTARTGTRVGGGGRGPTFDVFRHGVRRVPVGVDGDHDGSHVGKRPDSVFGNQKEA